jgi:signal transduction histidine kinase
VVAWGTARTPELRRVAGWWAAARRPASAADLAVAAGATVILLPVAAILDGSAGLQAWRPVLLATATLAFGWRRVAPLSLLACQLILLSCYLLADGGAWSAGLSLAWGLLAISVFEVARQLPPRASGTTCALASSTVAALWLCQVGTWAEGTASVLPPLSGVALGLPWTAGALVWLRTRVLTRQREQLIARAVDDERRRLARELHDIAGHALAVSAMQAGVALVALDDDPAQARRSMDAVQLASSRALGELRALLRSCAEQPVAGRPGEVVVQPAGEPRAAATAVRGEQGYGFAELRELVDNVRSAGLSVRLRLTSPEPSLDPELARVTYRVVQESLTNVIRHAGTSEASVAVTPVEDWLQVRITDRGSSSAQVAPGLGLAGMQERVRSVGGRLYAGPASGGGFVVDALLPLQRAGVPMPAGR